MRKFKIFIDSCGEMAKEMRDAHGVLFVPMTLTINEKGGIKEIPALVDYDGEYDFKGFYDAMRNGTRFKTAAVNEAEFAPYFEKVLEEGFDILYLACSSGLSISVNNAAKLGKKLEEKYPGSAVVAVDTLISGFPIADMAILADNLMKEGKGVREVAEVIEGRKAKYNQFATVESLNYLKDAGRVTASSAFFGNLFNIKPIIISDAKGHNVAMKKMKGRRAALDEIVRLSVEAAEDIENQTVYISHGDCLEDAEYLKAKLLEVAKPKEVIIGKVGPIIGASSGPGCIIMYVYGKEVTYVGE